MVVNTQILKNVSCDYDQLNGWKTPAVVSTTDGWLKLNFASCVVRKTRSLGALVLCSMTYCVIWCLRIASTIWLLILSSTSFMIYRSRVFYIIPHQRYKRWLPWAPPGSTGRFYKDDVVHNHSQNKKKKTHSLLDRSYFEFLLRCFFLFLGQLFYKKLTRTATVQHFYSTYSSTYTAALPVLCLPCTSVSAVFHGWRAITIYCSSDHSARYTGLGRYDPPFRGTTYESRLYDCEPFYMCLIFLSGWLLSDAEQLGLLSPMTYLRQSLSIVLPLHVF